MVDACSKRAMPEWFRATAIQHIRPVDIDALDSDRFWKKWDRVDESQVRLIATKLLAKVAQIEPPASDCFLFDTTNSYTYMASDTDSELAMRGKNKEGRDWLRQIGLALLVARDTNLPIFYREYEGTAGER
jgi:transposase